MQPACRCQVRVQRRAVIAHGLERSHQSLLDRDAAIGQVERNDRDRRHGSRERELRQHGEGSPHPVTGPRQDGHRNHDRREDQEVAGRVRHDRHPQREPQRVFHPGLDEQAIGGEQRERKTVGVKRLQVGEPHEQVRVERKRARGDEGGAPVRGPFECDDVRGKCTEREPGNDEQIVDENRRAAEPPDRRTEQRRDDQRLREGEGVMRGIEDVGFKEMERVARQLVLDPREDPLVEHDVAVVVSRVARAVHVASGQVWRTASSRQKPSGGRARRSHQRRH